MDCQKKSLMNEIADSILVDGVIDYEKLIDAGNKLSVTGGEVLESLIPNSKQLLAIYGNCHTLFYYPFCRRSSIIKRDYIILKIPPIQSIKLENGKELSESILKKVDVFIYQNVKNDNKFNSCLSSDYIISQLRKNVVLICIPNVFLSAYFPQHCVSKHNPQIVNVPGGPCPYGDSNIESLYLQGYSAEQIADLLNKEDFYDKEFVIQNMERTFEELKNREKQCDVKISDYLESRYLEEQLFFTVHHPHNVVLKEIMVRTFDLLNIDVRDVNVDTIANNDRREALIYPSVKKALGIKFEKELFAYFDGEKHLVNFSDYVKAYIAYCFNKDTTSTL